MSMSEKRHIISLLVENEFGSLSRIAGLFSARGYNIHCLNVAPTNDESISRMTLVTFCNDQKIKQLAKQLGHGYGEFDTCCLRFCRELK